MTPRRALPGRDTRPAEGAWVDVRAWLRRPRARGILLAAIWLVLALHGIGDVAIVGDDEAREVGIAQDAAAGHWLWPRFNDELLPDKPTLSHWLAAVPVALTGFSETAVRLPSILAAAGTIWWTVEFGSWLLGPPAGLAAGVMLATMRSFFAHARVSRPDTLLALFLALALGCAYRWWRDGRRGDATLALVFVGLGVLAKGPVAPALFAVAFGLFLLWQRDLRRLLGFWTLAGLAAFAVLGLGWYVLAWAGWGDAFVEQHLLGRYVRNLAGGLATGGGYSPKPWYHHAFFYPQHLPAVVWPWTPFIALAVWLLWQRGGLRDPRARFLICWALAPVIVFTPAEWKLRYYLLPSLPPLALLAGPSVARLVVMPVLPLRVTWGSVAAALLLAAGAATAALIYLGRPEWLSASDQLTRDAVLRALGGASTMAAIVGVVAGMAAVAVACRAWGGLIALVAGAGLLWLALGEPGLEAATSRRDSLKAFASEAAARYPPGKRLAFYGATVRPVVVYVGRPVPSLGRQPDRIEPGMGVIAFEPAYRALAEAGYVGPPIATAEGRIGNVERATLVLSEGRGSAVAAAEAPGRGPGTSAPGR